MRSTKVWPKKLKKQKGPTYSVFHTLTGLKTSKELYNSKVGCTMYKKSPKRSHFWKLKKRRKALEVFQKLLRRRGATCRCSRIGVSLAWKGSCFSKNSWQTLHKKIPLSVKKPGMDVMVALLLAHPLEAASRTIPSLAVPALNTFPSQA